MVEYRNEKKAEKANSVLKTTESMSREMRYSVSDRDALRMGTVVCVCDNYILTSRTNSCETADSYDSEQYIC